VYHYFSSKADIVMGAFDLIGERVEAGIEEAVRLSRTPADALERLARSYIQVAFDGLDLMVATSREREAVRRSARNRLQRRNRFVRDSWVSVVRQVRLDAPDSEIRLLVRTVFPLMQQAVEASEGHREFLEELVGPTVAYLTL
jgi:AcrR family transcriptional regulator